MAELLKRMKSNDVTVHGFRATFKTWSAERTNFPREIAEASLAHVVGNKVEQAYMRGDMLARRRELMVAWARFCAGADCDANVVSFDRQSRFDAA